MSSKTVSIVIPTFNRSGFVERAINSSLNQTHKCEVVVCDHGSNDDTPEVMKKYENKITYIRREKDFGPHFCWLEGVLNASSEYVHIQFDDDWVDESFVEKALGLMGDDVGVVFANARVVNLVTNEARPCTFLKKNNLKTGIYNNKILEKGCLKKEMISPAACLYRKKDVIDAMYQGRLPISTDGDYHGVGPDFFMMMLTLLKYKDFGYIREELVFFGNHSDSITIDAHSNKDKSQKINSAYQDVRKFYKMLKTFDKLKFFFK